MQSRMANAETKARMKAMKQRMHKLFRVCRLLSTLSMLATVPTPFVDNDVALVCVSVHYTCAAIVVFFLLYVIITTLGGLITDLDGVNEGKEGAEINEKVESIVTKLKFLRGQVITALIVTLPLALP